jgi:hypothetical protein
VDGRGAHGGGYSALHPPRNALDPNAAGVHQAEDERHGARQPDSL